MSYLNNLMECLRPEYVENFYQGMSEPEGYGAFDEYQRSEDIVDPCENCEIKDKSECCTADIILHDICSECGEHCQSTCDNCDFKN